MQLPGFEHLQPASLDIRGTLPGRRPVNVTLEKRICRSSWGLCPCDTDPFLLIHMVFEDGLLWRFLLSVVCCSGTLSGNHEPAR